MTGVRVRVLIHQQPADASLTDITDRVLHVAARIGRGGEGHTRFAAGVCEITASPSDDWLAPIGTGAVTAQDVIGQTVQITGRLEADRPADARSLFTGRVEQVSWDFDGALSHVTIVAVDDLAVLAQTVIDVTGMPDELTGARLKRLLTAAGLTATAEAAIDDGTVTCTTDAAEGHALELCEQVADTEGGWLWAAHGQPASEAWAAAQVGGTAQIAMSYRSRPADEAALVIVDGIAAQAEVSTADAIVVELAADLLVTRVEITHPGGTVSDAAPDSVLDRVGDHTLERTVLSSASDAADLGDWILATFDEPLLHVRQVRVFAHLEASAAVRALLAASVGSTVDVHQVLPGGATVVTCHLLERMEWTITPWDMTRGRVAWDCTIGLWPAGAVIVWTLGSSTLGSDTRLGPAASTEFRIDTPGGHVRWAAGDQVSAVEFGAGIAAQTVPRYDDRAALIAAESEGPVGLLAATADGTVWARQDDGWRMLASTTGL